MEIRVICNAKINLFLRILGKRKDGYHDIETLYHSISLSDQLLIEKRESGIVIECDNPDVPCDKNNLVAKAASILLSERKGGVAVRIEKQIPVGAGLGGGSADAAGALLGINQLLNLGLSLESLDKICSEIGSDVRFMLYGGCAVGRGRGNILDFLSPLPTLPVVLVKPPFMISTRCAYQSIDTVLTISSPNLNVAIKSLQREGFRSFCKVLHNDFEPVVFKKLPLLNEIKMEHLNRGALGALMSGSGPTVFGIYKDIEIAKSAEGFFRGMGYWSSLVFLTNKGIGIVE